MMNVVHSSCTKHVTVQQRESCLPLSQGLHFDLYYNKVRVVLHVRALVCHFFF